VDARLACRPDRVPGPVDIGLVCTRQPGDDRRAVALPDLDCDAADRLVVARRRDGKARFDDVHAQPDQLARDFQLLVDVQRCARRLLPIAQRGVKDTNNICHKPPRN